MQQNPGLIIRITLCTTGKDVGMLVIHCCSLPKLEKPYAVISFYS